MFEPLAEIGVTRRRQMLSLPIQRTVRRRLPAEGQHFAFRSQNLTVRNRPQFCRPAELNERQLSGDRGSIPNDRNGVVNGQANIA